MKINQIYLWSAWSSLVALAVVSVSGLALVMPGVASAADDAPAAVASAAGNVDAGRRVFNRNCRSCHQVEAGAGSQLGPNLAGLVGRAARADREFEYSAAFQAAADGGVVWDVATLERFLAAPTKMIPGTTMPMAVTDATQRRDLVAFLATLSP